jgi:hypothetical protein
VVAVEEVEVDVVDGAVVAVEEVEVDVVDGAVVAVVEVEVDVVDGAVVAVDEVVVDVVVVEVVVGGVEGSESSAFNARLSMSGWSAPAGLKVRRTWA